MRKIAKFYINNLKGTIIDKILTNTGAKITLQVAYDNIKSAQYKLAHMRINLESRFPNKKHELQVGKYSAKFYVKSGVERDMFPRAGGGISEAPFILDLIDELESGDVFFDVGTNIGTFSCLVGVALEDKCQIICFEPYPDSAQRAVENFNLNNIDNICMHEVGLANTNKVIEFNVAYGHTGAGGRIQTSERWEKSGKMKDVIRRPVRKGDSLINSGEIPEPNVLKIDIDGEELNAIKGLKNTLANNDCRAVFIEVHSYVQGGSPADVVSYLQNIGFEGYRSTPSGKQPISSYEFPGSADRLIFLK